MKKSPFRLLGRIAFLLLVLVLLGVGLVLAWFTSWRADKLVALDAMSEVIPTSLGNVECVVRGTGNPVLIFHGTPGGFDQALVLAAGLPEAGFQVIAPSRPGYLRTPLSSGVLPEQQADAFSALLDNLDISDVAVIGLSGGAPAALEFVLRHPQRVRCLVLISGVTKSYDQRKGAPRLTPGLVVLDHLTGDVSGWIALKLAEHKPQWLLEQVVGLTNKGTPAERAKVVNAALNNPAELARFRGLMDSFAPLSSREAGIRNDVLMAYNLPDTRLSTIAVPTLMIHGTLDSLVPVEDAAAVAAKIPGAQFLPVAGAGHLVFLGPEGGQIGRTMIDFLQQHTAPPPEPPDTDEP